MLLYNIFYSGTTRLETLYVQILACVILIRQHQPHASFCSNDSFEVDKWKCKQVLMIPKRLSSNTNFCFSCVLVVVLGTSLFQKLNHQVGFSYSGIRLKPRDLVFHVRIERKYEYFFKLQFSQNTIHKNGRVFYLFLLVLIIH